MEAPELMQAIIGLIEQQNQIFERQAQAMERIAENMEVVATAFGNGQSRFSRSIAEFQTFEWKSIGATIISRDRDGNVAEVEWSGNLYQRRSKDDAIWYNRNLGGGKYDVLIRFRPTTKPKTIPEEVLEKIELEKMRSQRSNPTPAPTPPQPAPPLAQPGSDRTLIEEAVLQLVGELGWSRQQASKVLADRYNGKQTRQELTVAQLKNFLEYLTAIKNSHQGQAI